MCMEAVSEQSAAFQHAFYTNATLRQHPFELGPPSCTNGKQTGRPKLPNFSKKDNNLDSSSKKKMEGSAHEAYLRKKMEEIFRFSFVNVRKERKQTKTSENKRKVRKLNGSKRNPRKRTKVCTKRTKTTKTYEITPGDMMSPSNFLYEKPTKKCERARKPQRKKPKETKEYEDKRKHRK